jgi:hypothetical protein
MFYKPLKIVKNEDIVLEMKIMIVSIKHHMFLPGDQFILFNSNEMKPNFTVPKKSQVFIDNLLVGITGASGSLDIKSDHFTGMLYALYICS